MSNDLERGLGRQKQRYQMLRELYQRVGTHECLVEDFLGIAQRLGIDREAAEAVLLYLEGESLLERVNQGQSILMTDKGVFEVEQSLSHPNESTEHFSALTIHSYAPAHSIGTKAPSVVTAAQESRQNQAELLQLIDALRQSISALPAEQRQEANEYLADLQAEVTAPTPKLSRLKATLIALWYTGEAFVPFAAQVCAVAQELGIHLPTAVSRRS